MEDLFEEARRLSQTLKNWEESLRRGSDLTSAMRSVLDILRRHGPMTVPAAARARGVSRQHIQQQVDLLLERKLVRREPNPAHRRSPRIALTDRGRALSEHTRAQELDALSRMRPGVSDHATRDAARVVEAWRRALEENLGAMPPST